MSLALTAPQSSFVDGGRHLQCPFPQPLFPVVVCCSVRPSVRLLVCPFACPRPSFGSCVLGIRTVALFVPLAPFQPVFVSYVFFKLNICRPILITYENTSSPPLRRLMYARDICRCLLGATRGRIDILRLGSSCWQPVKRNPGRSDHTSQRVI